MRFTISRDNITQIVEERGCDYLRVVQVGLSNAERLNRKVHSANSKVVYILLAFAGPGWRPDYNLIWQEPVRNSDSHSGTNPLHVDKCQDMGFQPPHSHIIWPPTSVWYIVHKTDFRGAVEE